MVGGGPVTPQQRQLANIRLELRSGKTRGVNPRVLTPEEVRARELRRDDLISRMVGRVNAHTTAEADRVIAGTKAVVAEAAVQVKDCFKESFCLEVRKGASAKERLDAIKTRQSVERGLMVQLRKEAAEERAQPKPRRAAVKAGKASSSGGEVKVEKASSGGREIVAEPAEAKRVCSELCRGTKQRPGKRCRVTTLPCRFHGVPKEDPPTLPAAFAHMLHKVDEDQRENLDATGSEEVPESLSLEERAEAREDKHPLGLVPELTDDAMLPDLGGGRRFVRRYVSSTDYAFDLPGEPDAPAAEVTPVAAAAPAAEEE